MIRIKVPAHRRATTTTRTTVQHDNRDTIWISALFHVNAMTVADIQHTLIIGINRLVKMRTWALLSYDFIHNHPISRVDPSDHDAER